jgi:hypothetical protein
MADMVHISVFTYFDQIVVQVKRFLPEDGHWVLVAETQTYQAWPDPEDDQVSLGQIAAALQQMAKGQGVRPRPSR